jgi:hypothetical protein
MRQSISDTRTVRVVVSPFIFVFVIFPVVS